MMKKLMIIMAILLAQGSALAKDTMKPNIIFILADDMGYADLGCFGAEKIKTPGADRMAEEGMKKNHCGADVEEIPAPQLYDMERDIGETTDVAAKHPETVEKLLKIAQKARADIGDYNQIGSGARFYDNGEKRPDVGKWRGQ